MSLTEDYSLQGLFFNTVVNSCSVLVKIDKHSVLVKIDKHE